MSESERSLIAPHILDYTYRRSLGPILSRFFTGLRDRELLGIRRKDGSVLFPPKEYDPDTSDALEEMVPVGDAGVVESWAWVPEPRRQQPLEHPFAYAYTHMPGNGAWYQFQYGSVFVVVLNTHAPANNQNPNRDQLVYLTQALSSPQAQAADFRVVTFHQSPYTNATQHDTTGCESCRQWWVPVFEDYGVDLVISGHFHSYQRGEQNGVTYVIVAGGGSALLIDTFDNWDFMTVQQTWMYSMMDVVNGQLTWETYNLQDELIDVFQLSAR